MENAIRDVNHKIIDLWEKHQKEINIGDKPLLGPLLYDSNYRFLSRGGLLFVGLNPSFVPDEITKILNKDENYVRSIFEWENRDVFENKQDLIIEVEKQIRDPDKLFFKVFQKVSDAVGLDCANIDLFFYRRIYQNEIETIVFKKGKRPKLQCDKTDTTVNDFSVSNHLREFAQCQLSFSKSLIEYVNPKIIVVANTLASDIFQKYYDLKWIGDQGYYTTQLNGKSVYVFMSSMLSGRGALDRFSLKRLISNIKWVKENKC